MQTSTFTALPQIRCNTKGKTLPHSTHCLQIEEEGTVHWQSMAVPVHVQCSVIEFQRSQQTYWTRKLNKQKNSRQVTCMSARHAKKHAITDRHMHMKHAYWPTCIHTRTVCKKWMGHMQLTWLKTCPCACYSCKHATGVSSSLFL